MIKNKSSCKIFSSTTGFIMFVNKTDALLVNKLLCIVKSYIASVSCLSIADAAFLPSPMAKITVAPPRTISPPA